MLDALWSRMLVALGTKVPPAALDSWLRPCRLAAVEGDHIKIAAPNPYTRDWLHQHHTESLQAAAREVLGGNPRISLDVDREAGLPTTTPSEAEPPVTASGLSVRYTFDSFVVGNSNQFAQAACQAVAELPSRAYNPLFIYGGVGLGKTHLLHAVGHQIGRLFPQLRLLYLSSERFTNDLINAIRYDRTSEFRAKYRTIDLLLIDDIQFISGKERTQEEFFHTFNDLYDARKQIVVSSDAAPKEIPDLEERLRSRFEWGLMVDIQPPDLETKMAILDKKAELEGVKLPEEVRIYIATKTKSNVRELEGALIKLIAYSSITNSPVTLQMAQQVLKYLISTGERRITMDSILRAVAEKFNMQPQQLKQKSNARQIAYPRQIAMYLIKDLTQASLPEIGRVFGGKHHTTVLHSVQKIERLRQIDTDLNRLIHSLIDSVH